MSNSIHLGEGFKFHVVPKPAPRITYQGRFSEKAIEYYEYKNDIKTQARLMGYEMGEILSLTFCIPVFKSWKQPMKQKHHYMPHRYKKGPDLDNLVKGFQDAMVENDAYVHTYGRMQKIWVPEGEGCIFAHTTISIPDVGRPGGFRVVNSDTVSIL